MLDKFRMIKKIKYISRNRVVQNFIYLSMAKGINLVVPVLITPFLIKTVGLESFGKVALMQAICAFFTVFCNYAFELSAVREISINKENKNQINFIITEVYFVRSILLLISFPLFICVSLFFFPWHGETLLIICSYCIVIGNAYLPDWFFQGMQDMKYIGITNGISKFAFIILVVILVRKPTDYFLSNFLFGISNLFVSGIGLIVIKNKFKVKKISYFKHNFKVALLKNRYLVQSNLLVAIYGYSGTLILGFFTDSKTVGVYSALERIIFILKSTVSIIAQTLYPKVCHFSDSLKEMKNYYKRTLPYYGLPYIILCFFVIIFAPTIQQVFHIYNEKLVLYLRIFSISAILEIILMPYAYMLLAMKRNVDIFKTSLISTLISTILGIILVYYLGILGTILTFIFTQIALYALYNRVLKNFDMI